MTETYREEQEANYGESVAQRFIKGLEDEIGVPNAFGSEELEDEETMESLMDDDSWEKEEDLPDDADMYGDNFQEE